MVAQSVSSLRGDCFEHIGQCHRIGRHRQPTGHERLVGLSGLNLTTNPREPQPDLLRHVLAWYGQQFKKGVAPLSIVDRGELQKGLLRFVPLGGLIGIELTREPFELVLQRWLILLGGQQRGGNQREQTRSLYPATQSNWQHVK